MLYSGFLSLGMVYEKILTDNLANLVNLVDHLKLKLNN